MRSFAAAVAAASEAAAASARELLGVLVAPAPASAAARVLAVGVQGRLQQLEMQDAMHEQEPLLQLAGLLVQSLLLTLEGCYYQAIHAEEESCFGLDLTEHLSYPTLALWLHRKLQDDLAATQVYGHDLCLLPLRVERQQDTAVAAAAFAAVKLDPVNWIVAAASAVVAAMVGLGRHGTCARDIAAAELQ